MNKFLAILILTSIASGCALTAPDGTKQLEMEIARDKRLQRDDTSVLSGELQFVKVRAYPQMRSGNIIGSHWILMQMGRKDINFNSLLSRIKDNDQSATE